MKDLSNYYVTESGLICTESGLICIAIEKPVQLKSLPIISSKKLFEVVGFCSIGLLKHKEIR